MRRFAIALLAVAVLGAGPGSDQAQAPISPVKAWVAANQPALVRELIELLQIPNVAADRPNIRRNAEHLRGMLSRRGFAAELLETAGNPLVYGEMKGPGATRTLLLYAHYDGQPVDAKAWQQPDPFTPVLRPPGGAGRSQAGTRPLTSPDGALSSYDPDWRLYARSAADDKAPI